MIRSMASAAAAVLAGALLFGAPASADDLSAQERKDMSILDDLAVTVGTLERCQVEYAARASQGAGDAKHILDATTSAWYRKTEELGHLVAGYVDTYAPVHANDQSEATFAYLAWAGVFDSQFAALKDGPAPMTDAECEAAAK
jgi:hypothetical protein